MLILNLLLIALGNQLCSSNQLSVTGGICAVVTLNPSKEQDSPIHLGNQHCCILHKFCSKKTPPHVYVGGNYNVVGGALHRGMCTIWTNDGLFTFDSLEIPFFESWPYRNSWLSHQSISMVSSLLGRLRWGQWSTRNLA